MDVDRFMATKEVKCDTCGGNDTLDAMVRKDSKKGLYECKDCHIEADEGYLMLLGDSAPSKEMLNSKDVKKTRRLLAWCFG
jgi:hypothetical protein